MAQWVKGLAALDYCAEKGEKKLLKGYSDLHTCIILYMHTHVHTHTHINFTKKSKSFIVFITLNPEPSL